jgi:hypothetical protein
MRERGEPHSYRYSPQPRGRTTPSSSSEAATVMEMAVRLMETAETAMETDGDCSGGTSPSQQGAGTETSIPRNSSVAAAELQNCSGKNADCFRVFCQEASYRQRGIVRRWPRRAHHGWARPGAGPRPPVVWPASGPSPAPVWSSSSVQEK